MRRIVDNDTVAHHWAHRVQPSARNGNDSYSFTGPDLYSYSTRIARLATNGQGRTAAIFNSRSYSITTTGHQSRARRAASHLPQFSVAELADTPEEQREAIAERLQRTAEEIPNGHNRPARAKRFDAYRSAVASANEFCDFFDLPRFDVPSADADVEATIAELRRQQEERERKAKQRRRRQAAKEWRETQKRLARWIAGEDVGSLYGLPNAYMRIQGDEIVTTLGARVPVSHVRRFAPMILEIIREGRTYTADPDRPIRFGHYHLDSIDSDGTVRAGCHRFARSEVERVAELIGTAELVTA
jgi:hypothetical protein